MGGAIKTFVRNISNPYSFEGGKLTTHRNPFTAFKSRFSPSDDHALKVMKRDLLIREMPLQAKKEQIGALLSGKNLSQDEIVFFLKHGSIDSKTRQNLLLELGPLAIVEYDIVPISPRDLETVAKRLQPRVNIEKALELVKIKTPGGEVLHKELKKMLLENALKEVLCLNALGDAGAKAVIENQWLEIAKALKDVGGIPDVVDDNFPYVNGKALFERFLIAVGKNSFKDSLGILDLLEKKQRSVALRILTLADDLPF